MSLQDYAQRRYDYLALQNVQRKGDSLLGLELFNSQTSGKICTGVQKLAQRWLLEFMTERGSLPGLPERGCNFMKAARTGGFRTRINVETIFSSADMLIRRNLVAEEYADMPADEKFGSAELLSVAILPTFNVDQLSGTTAIYINMRVKITSLAGDEHVVIFPVETLP
jgi:hypothetical protein